MDYFVKRILEIPVKALVRWNDPVTGKLGTLQVKTAEKLFEHREYRDGWKRSGTVWSALFCATDDQTDALFAVIGEDQYLFVKRNGMGPEGFKKYEPVGQQFGRTHKATLAYEGDDFDVKLIGQWDVVPHEKGEGHIPAEGHIARWMLAQGSKVSETSDGEPVVKAVLVEDCNGGSTSDSVWVGWKVSNLDRVIREVLTK